MCPTLAALQVFAGFVDIKEGKTSDGNWEASARQNFSKFENNYM